MLRKKNMLQTHGVKRAAPAPERGKLFRSVMFTWTKSVLTYESSNTLLNESNFWINQTS